MTRTLELDLGSAGATRLPFALPVHLSLRAAGDMGPSGAPTQSRRDALLRDLDIDPGHYVTVRQVHSREVLPVTAEQRPGEEQEADGLVTDDSRLALGVTVADCMPIFLYARDVGAFGVLHSGWRGTGIVSDAIRLMERRYGAQPRELSILLGPSIGPCCYRVDDDRATLFSDLWGERAVTVREDGPYLDLRRANLDIVASHGVEDVSVVSDCTMCSPDLGSFRREGAERFTRMLAVIEGE